MERLESVPGWKVKLNRLSRELSQPLGNGFDVLNTKECLQDSFTHCINTLRNCFDFVLCTTMILHSIMQKNSSLYFFTIYAISYLTYSKIYF